MSINISNRLRGARRILLLGLAIALCGALVAACGSDDNDATGANGDSTSSGGDYRVVQVPTFLSEFTVTVQKGAEEEAEKLGVDFGIQIPASTEVSAQTATLNAVIATKPDAILLEPIDAKAMVPLVEAAQGQGIAVLTYDSTLENEDLPDSFVANDYVASGRHAAEKVLELTGDQGTYLHIAGSPGINITQRLIEGWEEALAEHPDVTALPPEFAQFEPSKGATIMSASLSAHPDLNGAFLGLPQEQEGALNALRAADAVDRVKTVAMAATPQALDNLREGNFDAVVAEPVAEYGPILIQTAIKILDGEQVPKFIPLEDCILTKKNMDDPDSERCIQLPLD